MSEDGTPTPPQQPVPPPYGADQPQPPYGAYQPQPPYGAYQPPPPNHRSAVAALVLGILSIVLCGLFTGIPAMVMGRRVVREVRASGGALGGEGLGQAGFWTGLIGTVLSGLSLLLVVALFAFGSIVSSTGDSSCQEVTPNGHSRPC